MTRVSRVLLLVVWLAFIVYALFFAPGAGGGEDPWLRSLLRLQSDEPSLMAMFTLLGLFPLTFACMLLRHDDRKVPAWPFVLLSFALGVFALLPYYMLTSATHAGSHDLRLPEKLRRTAEWSVTHAILFVLTLSVMVWGLALGDLNVYAEAFRTSHFVRFRSADPAVRLCDLYGLAPAFAASGDGAARLDPDSRSARLRLDDAHG